MSVPQRVSLVTLGVADVARATAFYRSLGWRESDASNPGDVTFFATPGLVLALWGIGDLAVDSGLRDSQGVPDFRGVALAINVASVAEVDDHIATWIAAGGSVRRLPVSTDWGGYSGYVADPEGNLWEIAHNPSWPLDDRGLPVIPGSRDT